MNSKRKPSYFEALIFQHSRLWIWCVLFLSFLVCFVVSYIHYEQHHTIRLTLDELSNFRQARLDLSKGFLHVTLADLPDSPFGQAEGLALLKQAISTFEEDLGKKSNIDSGIIKEFKKSIAAFSEELKNWKREDKSYPAKMVQLRVLFNELERQADILDAQAQHNIVNLTSRLDRQFAIALVVASVLLAAICLVVFQAGRIKDELEQVSHESELRFCQAMDATSDGLWDWNIKTNEIYYSPSNWRMLGYETSEFEGTLQEWEKLTHPADREIINIINKDCIENRIENFNVEFRIKTRDGTYKWILRRGKAVERDSDMRAIRLIGTHVDISRQKEAEEAIKANEAQFRAIFEVASVGIFQAMPANGRIVRYNEKYKMITGYPDAELKEMKFQDLLHPEDKENNWETFQKAAKGEIQNYNSEKRLIRKDGSIIWVRLSASFIRDENEAAVLTVAICEDITERKKAEEEKEKLQGQLTQSQKMESIGRLAGGVAHDFNNLLGVILGHTEIAMEQIEPKNPLMADLKEINETVERAAKLTRQLLAFARKQAVTPRVLDLNETVESMLKMIRRLIGENIELSWLPGRNLWKTLIDPAQVDQILANLCVNSRDAISDVGKLIIETENVIFDTEYCNEHPEYIPGEYVLLAVSDNGSGMDKKTLERIFEPFFTTKGLGQGTGLGLATVYGIVKQNNGFINVYSEPDKGTTFKIYLPRHISGDMLPAETAKPVEIPKGNGEVILIVEDEPTLLEMTARGMRAQGYTVLGSETPAQALRLAKEYSGEMHLLLTDVVMPGMNGRELAERIIEIRPKIKCLYMSGYTANVIAHHRIPEGEWFIQKPFSRQELAKKIKMILEK